MAEANIATIKAEWNRVNPHYPVMESEVLESRAMSEEMPRIEAVSVEGTGKLSVKWRGKYLVRL